MLRIASLTLVGGAVLLMTWVLAPAATRSTRAVAPSAAERDRTPAPGDLADFEREIERMRARLISPPAYAAPARDPFQFAGRSVAPRREAAPVAVATPPPPVLPRLVAILSDTVDGAVVRRAALAFDGAVRIAGVGDLVGALRLRAITADGIELADPVTSATFRLSLR